MEPQLLSEFPYGAIDKRSAVEGILASNMSPSPNYDLIMKGLIAPFFTSAKTKYVTIRIPNNHHGKRLDARSILLHLISGLEIAIVTFLKMPRQFIRFGTINKILVSKEFFYGFLGA